MHTALFRVAPLLAAVVCCALLYQIVLTRPLPDIVSLFTTGSLQNFKTLFISIVLEALPFILLGVFLSSLLHLFVSESVVRRLVPKNPVIGILFACVLGFIFPICECGMIPVVRRLMRKGMPLYIAVVFILAGPVLNPVVYASTYMAFRSQPEMAYARMGLAFLVAASIGLILYRTIRRNPLRHPLAAHPSVHVQGHGLEHSHGHEYGHWHGDSREQVHVQGHSHEHGHIHNHLDGHEHGHGHNHEHDHTHGNKLTGLLSHASEEFFEMGKYLLLGAAITAVIQTTVSRESMLAVGQGDISSQLFMVGFAYILSLCSTSDAFVASSFATTFSKGSLLTFLVFGPMVDFKGTLMLLSIFKTRFVLLVIILVAVAVLAGSMLFERLGLI